MGLDMFIHKRPKYSDDRKQNFAITYFITWIRKGLDCTFEEWCGAHVKASDLPNIETLIEILNSHPIEDGEFIEEEVAYWRKANCIHRWFVENVQDCKDDCQEHRPITKEDLQKLKNDCKAVLNNPALAEEVLPTMPGFFFGDTEYDEWYFETIERTSELCEELIEETDFDEYELYYRSSW